MLELNKNEFDEYVINFSKKIKPGDIILLNGEMGVGKTTFVKALAKGLNIKKIVTSPTFNIIKEYDNKLCHIDAYRINDEYIEISEYVDKGYIICIEWPNNILNSIPYFNYSVNIKYKDENIRMLDIKKKIK